MNNIGKIDRLARLLVGMLLVTLVFIGPKTVWGWIGVIPLITAIIAYCPLYTVLGINCPDEHCHTQDNT